MTMQKPKDWLWLWVGFVTTMAIIGGVWWSMNRTPTTATGQKRFAYGIHIEQIPVGGLTATEAEQKLTNQLPPLSEFNVVLKHDNNTWATGSARLGWHRDIPAALAQAQSIGQDGSLAWQFRRRAEIFFTSENVTIPTNFQEALVRQWVASISAQIDQPGHPPQAKLNGKLVVIDPGEKGSIVNRDEQVRTILHNPNQKEYVLRWQESNTPLTEDQVKQAELRLQPLATKRLIIQASELEPVMALSAEDFLSWLLLPEGYAPDQVQEFLDIWEKNYNRPPQNAELVLSGDGTRATTFVPHRLGRQLDRGQTLGNIWEALATLETDPAQKEITVPLAFVEAIPEKTLGDLNTLGIKEMIGFGTSTYKGSIVNRVYNVGLTSSRMHAVIVPPGEEFSFNRSVGEISAKTGYRSAYIIRNGRTELGDGGGVCQVSTTVFRAALNAGLPITVWRAHSYRVGYYEQNSPPGYDATVYSPSQDFRFRNDTGHSLLVASYADTENRFLRVEIWGTSDGRTSETSQYYLGNQRPAPAPLYQPDDSLPVGTTRQVDWAAAGATTSFHYQVKSAEGDVTFEKTFRSVYRPWQAVFLVGTKQ
jgi:vancomycin resistance protein YoaR